ncbi:MAG TPA: hypothetical protein VN181_07900 [Thermoanaerobaculia bacterium]|nr:hypothetical protein [Thermoanaerobaculia bacterium]
MSRRVPSRRAEIIALARAINRRRLEFKETYANEVFKRDGAVSRILENDPDYKPHRARKSNRKRRPVVNPGIFTIKDIAERLHTTVGTLLGEKGFEITIDDRRRMREFIAFLSQRFALNDPHLDE